MFRSKKKPQPLKPVPNIQPDWILKKVEEEKMKQVADKEEYAEKCETGRQLLGGGLKMAMAAISAAQSSTRVDQNDSNVEKTNKDTNKQPEAIQHPDTADVSNEQREDGNSDHFDKKPITDDSPKLNGGSIHSARVLVLLGESGVGKSLLINSLAHYIAFESLENVLQTSSYQWLIPTRFDLFLDSSSAERTVITVGGASSDHDNLTEKTQCYGLKIGDSLLTLIDTPGFSDSSGEEEAEQKMQEIVEFLSRNFLSSQSFFSPVVFMYLLTSNQTRNNFMFPLYMEAVKKICDKFSGSQTPLFGFTYYHGTSYRPGDGFNLLKEQLAMSCFNSLALKPSDCFFFDNESIQLLAMSENGKLNSAVDIDNRSWEASRKATIRLLNKLGIELREKPHIEIIEMITSEKFTLKFTSLLMSKETIL